MREYKGTAVICGKRCQLEVKAGIAYVDGEESGAYIDRMIAEGNYGVVSDFAKLGQQVMRGDLPTGSKQQELTAITAARTQRN